MSSKSEIRYGDLARPPERQRGLRQDSVSQVARSVTPVTGSLCVVCQAFTAAVVEGP